MTIFLSLLESSMPAEYTSSFLSASPFVPLSSIFESVFPFSSRSSTFSALKFSVSQTKSARFLVPISTSMADFTNVVLSSLFSALVFTAPMQTVNMKRADKIKAVNFFIFIPPKSDCSIQLQAYYIIFFVCCHSFFVQYRKIFAYCGRLTSLCLRIIIKARCFICLNG